MSWKSLVSAGLLCVLASPAFAVPTLHVESGGLNATGDWIWNVSITPTGTTSPVAAELGFRATGSGLLNATKGAMFTGANTDNPGTQIFTWETLTDQDPGPATNNRPQGLQTNTTNDEVFSALGSIGDVSGKTGYVTIITEGPRTTALTSNIVVLGKYGAGNANGRIAEITTGTNSQNYDNFSGTATRTTFAGDINLDGTFNFNDVAAFSPNFGKAATNGWLQGDWNRDGQTNFSDVATMSPNFNKMLGVNTPLVVMGTPGAAAAVDGGSVPEPASIALVSLAVLAGLGFTLRKRQ
jgi:hypothetical protein